MAPLSPHEFTRPLRHPSISNSMTEEESFIIDGAFDDHDLPTNKADKPKVP
jgi:hypothetical protein